MQVAVGCGSSAEASTRTRQHIRLTFGRVRKLCNSKSLAEALPKRWYYSNFNILVYRVSILKQLSTCFGLHRRSLLRRTSAFYRSTMESCYSQEASVLKRLADGWRFRSGPGLVLSLLDSENISPRRRSHLKEFQQIFCFLHAPAWWVCNRQARRHCRCGFLSCLVKSSNAESSAQVLHVAVVSFMRSRVNVACLFSLEYQSFRATQRRELPLAVRRLDQTPAAVALPTSPPSNSIASCKTSAKASASQKLCGPIGPGRVSSNCCSFEGARKVGSQRRRSLRILHLE